MAYCNNCGTNSPDGTIYCTNCGATLNSGMDIGNTPAAPAAQQEGTLALLALIFGILGFVMGWAPAIAAIILGAIAMNQGDRSDKAKAGLILGIIATALPIVIAIVSIIAIVLFYIVYIIVILVIYMIAFAAMAGSYGMGF